MCYFPIATFRCVTENTDHCNNYGQYIDYLKQIPIEPCRQVQEDARKCYSVINKEMMLHQGLCQKCYTKGLNSFLDGQPFERFHFQQFVMKDDTDFYVFTDENKSGYLDGCISRPNTDMNPTSEEDQYVLLPFNDDQRVYRSDWSRLHNFEGFRQTFIGILFTQHPGYW
jgi:hypothetical protein